MGAYYNEHDAKAAAWLRELIKQGHIAPGDVDERSIEDVSPDDLQGYVQCHFFAGIGVWSYALRQAGWPDHRPVWTGSCPCQPFSAAGKGGGFADERHLWPAWFHLIEQCRPTTIFGEQVASKDGLGWLDLVQADLEGAGYASGAFDLCAAGVGAPHIRQRLYFVAHPDNAGSQGHGRPVGINDTQGRDAAQRHSTKGSMAVELADTDGGHAGAERKQPGGEQRQQQENGRTGELADAAIVGRIGWRSGEAGDGSRPVERPDGFRDTGGMDHAADARHDDARQHNGGSSLQPARPEQSVHLGGLADADNAERRSGGAGGDKPERPDAGWPQGASDAGQGGGMCRARPTGGFWGAADWLHCTDGKWRSIEPGTFPLAHGAPARVGRLRGYGNAIVAPLAQAFIEAYLEC